MTNMLPSFQRSRTIERRRVSSAAENDEEEKIHTRPRTWTLGVMESTPVANSYLIRNRPPRLIICSIIIASFILGYYFQVLIFYFHVRLGYTGEVLPTREVSLAEKFTQSLIEHTKRVVFVCKKTNWDFVGFIASPHTVLFAHEDVSIPMHLEDTLSIVRHSGVDSYLNLHNKTITIMSHVHRTGSHYHFYKQDDEAVVFWPHYYQCMQKCKNLGTCYAGDMHVNIGDVTNSNSYVFATGGSYFLGNELLKCLLDKPLFVRLDGLDYGEDKMVGKMIHYNKCEVQYVSCKWFNNREVYSPNAMIRMKKIPSTLIKEDTVLLTEEEQQQKSRQLQDYNGVGVVEPDGIVSEQRTAEDTAVVNGNDNALRS